MTLVSVAQYRTAVGDPYGTVPDDAAITAALADAQAQAEDYCLRPFTQAEYTERCYVYPNGMAYPTVTPVISVSAPANVNLQGDAVLLGSLTPWPLVSPGAFTPSYPAQGDITYVGGYTAGTCPPHLRAAIIQIARNLLNPVVLPGVPAGARSVQLGDVSLASDGPLQNLYGIDSVAAGILDGFLDRSVHGWQNRPVPTGN